MLIWLKLKICREIRKIRKLSKIIRMIEHLIVDSGGLVRNCPIETLAKNAYTVPGVVKEIRDKATRQRLKVLPYELKFRDPTPTSLAAVSAAAKESGDFSSLSAVDLQVLENN